MEDPHEFAPGGLPEVPDADCCFYCGKEADHENHKDGDGKSYVDTESVIQRLRYDGSLAPKMPPR